MESIVIRSVYIQYPGSSWHAKTADVWLKNGQIADVQAEGRITIDDALIVDGSQQILIPGLFDMHVNFGEPGYETKEDMVSGCAAAVAGGFTGVAIQPNTHPSLHSKTEIAFIKNISKNLPVDVFPIGTISKERQGKELAELYDMTLSGAVAFSDGNRSVEQSGLMNRALLYCKGFDGLIIAYAEDQTLAGNAKMNEGIMSTLLGMKGIPSLAEEVTLARDLFLAEYNDAPIHFTTISTAGAVDIIRKAKESGVKVTCDVAAHHLVLTDEALSGYDSLLKVKPPLRTAKDQEALIKGLKDGTIDAIVSQHTPHEIECKRVEFEVADFGITGLQTAFSLAVQAGIPLALIIEKMAMKPRAILRIPIDAFEIGADANFILVNPDELWIFDETNNKSKSSNSPFLNKELKGKVNFLAHNNQYFTSK